MEPRPHSLEPTAEALFAEFLERLEEGGEPADFDALCAAYPGRAAALRRVHVRWLAMTEAFGQLSQEGEASATPATAPSPTVDGLKARLGSAAGRLARYTLQQEIARGAMGRIVQAWDEELRREVALKIHRGELGDTRTQRRFLEEAQIAAQLDHPGIVSIHELGLDVDGRPFFAMQLVRGRDLGQVLDAVRRGEPGWTRERVLGVLLRVCEAMAFAHEKGVVHRDLKPANIMIGRFGETYVMDWGLALVRRQAGEAGAEQNAGTGAAGIAAIDSLRADIAAEDTDSALLTHHGEVVGTPAYMAPEQASGEPRATAAVDVYALGAILYQLLTGDMPYAAAVRSADAVLRALRAGPPAPLPDSVPPELRAICERAMARDPAARYASMLELGDDLRAFLEVRTVRAYATGRFAGLRKWIARNRTLAAVAAALVLALVVGSLAVTTLWIRADEDRQRLDASAARLQTELDRSAFQGARLSLQLDNSARAADALWRAHFLGRMPRATHWALKELAERDPYLVAVPEREDRPVAFTARGDAVLVGGADGRLQLRDPGTLAVVRTIGEPGPRLTAVAVDGDARVVAGNSDGEVLRFDIVAGREIERCAVHRAAVVGIEVVAGVGVVSAGADGVVACWSPADAAPRVLHEQASRLTAMAVRPTRDGVVVGDDEGTVTGLAFDGSWTFDRSLGEHTIMAIEFTDDDQRLWVGDNGHQVQLVDLVDAAAGWAQPTRNGTCRQLARMHDGAVIVGGWWRTDRMAADGSSFAPISLRTISRLAVDPERRRMVTTSTRSGLGVVELQPTWRRTFAGAGAAALSGDGSVVALVVGSDVRLHEVATGRLLRELPDAGGGAVAVDRTGRRLASADLQAGTISLFDLRSGERLCRRPGPVAGIGTGAGCNARFSPDGAELACVVGDEHVHRLRAADGETIAEYQLPGARVVALGWSGDGRWLAIGARGRTAVRVIEVASGRHRDEELAGSWPQNVPPTVCAVALSPDGGTLAVGNSNGPIVVRGPAGTSTVLNGHAGTVWGLQFAGNDPGALFSTGGSQGIACWDLDSAECCYQAVRDQAAQLEISDDGRTLSCVTPAGVVVLDLAYHDRHVAGNLPLHLDKLRSTEGLDTDREAELRDWAAAIMAEPWPRWR